MAMSETTDPVGGTRTPAAAPAAQTPSATGRASALLSTAQRLLPDGPLPVVLGGSALAVVGVIDWPVVAAIGVGCVALRRWHRTA
jgi:hypothetical protein